MTLRHRNPDRTSDYAVTTAIGKTYSVYGFEPTSGTEMMRGRGVVVSLPRKRSAWKDVRVVTIPTMPSWLDHVVRKIDEMTSLQDGWNGYSAPRPSAKAIGAAKAYARRLAVFGVRPRSVMPTAVGGVAFLIKDLGRSAVTEFYNNGGGCTAYNTDAENPVVRAFDDNDLAREANRAKTFLYGKTAD